MKTERSDFGKTKVLSPTESNVKIEQVMCMHLPVSRSMAWLPSVEGVGE